MPDPALPATNFSARWTGKVTPLFSETYTFFVMADNGARLSISGLATSNVWAPTIELQMPLVAGRAYDLKVEFQQLYGGASIVLEWWSRSQLREIVPTAALTP